MGRFKVKLERKSNGWYHAYLYEDVPNKPLRFTEETAVSEDREECLREIRMKRDYLVMGEGEPEWLDLADDVPEPQSLKAV